MLLGGSVVFSSLFPPMLQYFIHTILSMKNVCQYYA